MFEDFEFCVQRDQLENSDFELYDIEDYLSDDEPEPEPPAPALPDATLAARSSELDYFTGALAYIRSIDLVQAA